MPELIEILKIIIIKGKSVTIPVELEKEDYARINNIFSILGGKWNRKTQKHMFPNNPEEEIKQIIETGKIPAKNPNAFYPTQEKELIIMLDYADVIWGGEVIPIESESIDILEPSAGRGSIAIKVREAFPNANIDTVEFDEENCRALKEKGFEPYGMNFLEFKTEKKYDYIFTNPPFSYEGHRYAYIEHIMHSYSKLLKEHGYLICIAPVGFLNGKTKREREFYDLVASGLNITMLDDDAFKETGTEVKTVMFKIVKEELKEHLGYRNYVSYNFFLTLMSLYQYSDEFDKICTEMVSENTFNRERVKKYITSSIAEMRKENIYYPCGKNFLEDYMHDAKRIYQIDYGQEISSEYSIHELKEATPTLFEFIGI